MATLTRRRSRLETHLKEDGNLVLNMKTGVLKHKGYHREDCDPDDCTCDLDSFPVGRFTDDNSHTSSDPTHFLVADDLESYWRLYNVYEDELVEWL